MLDERGADMDALRQQLRDRTEDVAAALLGSPNLPLSSRHDLRFGRRGSLSVATAGERRGQWFEHGADEGGDLFSLIQRELSLDFPAAVRWALDLLGDPGCHTPPPQRTTAPSPAFHDALAPWGWRIWNDALPVAPECVAGRYLIGRGCHALPAEQAVRWVPSLPYGSNQAFPALLALVTDVTDANRALNLHRTWLAPDGSGKAPVDRPRLLLKGHRKAGGAIRLTPDDEVMRGLGVGEGLETCLTVLAAGWAPVWCCLDAGNVGAFPVLPGIEALTIFADHDPAGRRAAEKCAVRWHGAGCEARIVLPPTEGDDVNDWARSLADAA
jgi:Uncharacterized protein conserved in bacteria